MSNEDKNLKLFKYIKKGDYEKFKCYIKKSKINTEDIIDANGNTLLHICGNCGDDLITRYLLKNGLSLYALNNVSLSPLHSFLLFAEENRYKDRCRVRDVLRTLLPYLDKQEANFNNQTDVYQKLIMIYGELKTTEHLDSNSSADSDSSASDNEMEKIDSWNRKLIDDLFGTHSNHYDYYESFADPPPLESWDHWAENINQSYHNKYSKTSTTSSKNNKHKYSKQASSDFNIRDKSSDSKRKRPGQEIPRISPSKIRKFNENQKREFVANQQTELIRYEILCNKFFNDDKNTEIFYHNVPWPFRSGSSPRDFLLGNLAADSTEYKEVLKKNRVRWHIDRFMHRVGHRLNAHDKATIINKVTEISQILNDLIAK